MLKRGIEGLDRCDQPVCIVGSGPVGLALASRLVKRGLRVLMLESGAKTPDRDIQSLSGADMVDEDRHDDMAIAVARQLGGTSNLWGARCLPFDSIDYERRPFIDAHWPITADTVAAYLGDAVKATCSGEPHYRDPIPGLDLKDSRFSTDHLERWANEQKAQVAHADLIAGPDLELRTHATLVGLSFRSEGAVESATVANSETGERIELPIKRLVIAAGGLESARLLLACRKQSPERFGGADGPLGRYYMGHVIGEIADITFHDKAVDGAFSYYVDSHGSYVRRRIVPGDDMQRAQGLMNCAFWPVVPAVADPRHGSAILSLVYLALAYGPIGRLITAEAIRRRHIPEHPVSIAKHVLNLVSNAPSAAAFTFDFFRRRYAGKERLPGFFVNNPGRRYGLAYHSEQAPDRDSRVVLTDKVDRLGLPRLLIDYRYSAQDVDSVVCTHDHLEDWLGATGIGSIDYRMPREARADAVLAQARHGTHQIGLVRMGKTRADGVVDAELRCFDADNLFIASTGVLPTSGQANPTLTAVALALRLADLIASEAR